jgi:hypothetical protein
VISVLVGAGVYWATRTQLPSVPRAMLRITVLAGIVLVVANWIIDTFGPEPFWH